MDGYKTYVIAAAIAVVAVAKYFGVIDAEMAAAILVALGAGGAAALRHGIKQAAKK